MSIKDIPKRVTIECDHCKGKLRVPTGKVGVIKCPRCQSEFNADTRDNNDLTNCDRPKEYDVVLGGESPIPFNSVVLGGLEGVKYRLKSDDIDLQTAALLEALKYGDLGIDLAISCLEDINNKTKSNAYKTLRKYCHYKKVKKAISRFNTCDFFTCLSNIEIDKELESYYHIRGLNWICDESNTYLLDKIVVSPDEKYLITSTTLDIVENTILSDVQVWNLNTKKIAYSLIQKDSFDSFCNNIDDAYDTPWINHFGERKPAISPDGQIIVTVSENESIKVWDLHTGNLLCTSEEHSDLIIKIAISPDSKKIISSSCDDIIRVWDLYTGNLLHTLEEHLDYISNIAISPDSNILISSSEDQTIRVWNLNYGDYLYSVKLSSQLSNTIAFTPDGQSFISAGLGNQVKIWNLYTGQILKTLHSNLSDCSGFNSFIFTLDGNIMIGHAFTRTKVNGTITYDYAPKIPVWNLHTGELLYTLTGHTSPDIYSIELIPKSNFLLSHGDDAVNIWNVNTGDLLKTLDINSSGFSRNSTSSQNGETIFIADSRKIEIWGI